MTTLKPKNTIRSTALSTFKTISTSLMQNIAASLNDPGVLYPYYDESNSFHKKFIQELCKIPLHQKVFDSIVTTRENEDLYPLSEDALVSRIYINVAKSCLRRINDEETYNTGVEKARNSLTKGGMITG